jgi:hypothetical protein
MTSGTFTQHLFSTYERYRLHYLSPQKCRHAPLRRYMNVLVSESNGLLRKNEIGRSLESRTIDLITCGHGRKCILLWSQMHGDESTATLALMDILSLLVHHSKAEKWIDLLLRECTLHFLPMLNPDGAEGRQRRTAANIDMNRDAHSLSTPEAQLLRTMQRRLKPAFGFNLHDQELSSVGNSKKVTAIALLAPGVDVNKSVNRVRERAMRVGAVVARSLNQLVEGHVATYDDAYEPRAFGDNMQRWGTSTLLIESGHWPNDNKKDFIRKLNYVGILSALRAIGDGSYLKMPLDFYSQLEPNGKRVYDFIIRNVLMRHPRGWSHNVDIGLTRQANTSWYSRRVTVKEIGDLRTHAALERIEGGGRQLASNAIAIDQVLSLGAILKRLGIRQHH